jgi:ABC-type Fe3+-hydroxamate transport system substrate-binding protein
VAAINVKMDRLRDVPHSARLLASILGDSARVDSIAGRFEALLDSLERIPHPSPRRVAMVVWDNPPMVIGAGSFLTELITLAGGKNVFDDLPQPSPAVSIETIVGRNPDLLLLLSNDSAGPSIARRPEWQAVRAVRERRFGLLKGTEFGRPSLRAIQAVQELKIILSSPSPVRARPGRSEGERGQG